MQLHFHRSVFILAAFLLASSCAPVRDAGVATLAKAQWATRQVAPGVTWKYHHFEDVFDSRQSITVLDIDLDKVKADIHYVDTGFFRTSVAAENAGAVAAINGSFFDTKKGGSVVFFRYQGEAVKPSSPAPRAYWEAAGLRIEGSGGVSIMTPPEGGWSVLQTDATVLTSGPLLIYDGESVPPADEKFNTNRHPRTAVGLTRNNHLIAVVVDGRSSQAHGATIEELTRIMQALKCEAAMNLDGGGSSTAWVRGAPFNGVVNYPSDNKKFDHEGERSVSTAILFFEKN